MSKNRGKPKLFHIKDLRAKLSFDDGFAEKPVYAIKARTTEKEKGIYMLELIENNFGISIRDREEAFRRKMKEFNEGSLRPTIVPKDAGIKQFKFKRDEKGRIVSPFDKKKDS